MFHRGVGMGCLFFTLALRDFTGVRSPFPRNG